MKQGGYIYEVFLIGGVCPNLHNDIGKILKHIREGVRQMHHSPKIFSKGARFLHLRASHGLIGVFNGAPHGGSKGGLRL